MENDFEELFNLVRKNPPEELAVRWNISTNIVSNCNSVVFFVGIFSTIGD